MIQGEKGKTATKFICRSLDVSGGGFICKTDLEWLDKWQPAEWLTVGPDEFAWRQLNDVLVNKFGHILKAWFSELDTDNSNKLSWAEFHDACERLKLEGNMGAAWRWLDKDLVGWISLAAIDEESSNLLHSFKEWAESRFGSLPSFFKTVGSSTSTCALSYPELRVACRKFKWEGDAQVLFNCLTKNGDSVTLKDVAFLSNWGVYDYDNIRLLKETTDMLWKELLEGTTAAKKPRAPAVSRDVSVSLLERPFTQKKGSPSSALTAKPFTAPSLLGVSNATDSLHSWGWGEYTDMAKSMPLIPDNHCSPWAPWPGAPYARPVGTSPAVSPLIDVPETMVKLLAKSGRSLKSRSQTLKQSYAVSNGGMGSTFSKSSLKSAGVSRKRDLYGKI